MLTNRSLTNTYAFLNKKWFGNRLPKDMVVDFKKNARMPDCLGMTVFYKTRALKVHINSDLRTLSSIAYVTLLHEMVHIEIGYRYSHGPRFHKRMLDLAKKGAFKPYW